MDTVQEKTKPFILKLIQENLPQEEENTEEIFPFNDHLLYLIMALVGIVVVVYGFAVGVFSYE